MIPSQDAEPGKVLHETRNGEMATLGEMPFGRYYGSVDATPLFVLLAGAYYERTADRPFAESIWPNVEAALAWIDDFGDRDGDGFVEYERRAADGLIHQGWKDSDDAVSHADGTPGVGPHRPVRGSILCLCGSPGRRRPGRGPRHAGPSVRARKPGRGAPPAVRGGILVR